MSDLQFWLLVAGAVIIAGVVIYNRVQEQRLRQRTERAFAPSPSDALLAPTARAVAPAERIEPQFQPSAEEAFRVGRQETIPVAPRTPRPTQEAPGSAIDYVAQVESANPIPAARLTSLLESVGPLAARVRLHERANPDEKWTPVDLGRGQAARAVRVMLQLADRRGAVSAQDLSALQSAVAVCAAGIAGDAQIPDPSPFVSRAQELDQLCAEVDVVVGMNIVAPPGHTFSGVKLRAQAEIAGFRWVESSGFTYFDANRALFVLENQGPIKLTLEGLRTLTSKGVTLLLDVPRQADGVRAFDQMIAVGRRLATGLGATLVDDNNVPVSDAGLEQIRAQLRGIYGAMESRGIAPGGAVAMRLFS